VLECGSGEGGILKFLDARALIRVSHFQLFEIPLDYSINVDRKVEALLSYGHINVYTPSLFRYLLNTEGYEILAERLTKTAAEVVKFGWYQRQGVTKSVSSEMKLALRPLRNSLRRLLSGKRIYDEYAYDRYTCLTKGTGSASLTNVKTLNPKQ